MKILGSILMVGFLGGMAIACSGNDSSGGGSNPGTGGNAATGGSGGGTSTGGGDSTGGTSTGGGDSTGGTSTGGGGNTIQAASCGPDASTNVDGILTPYPNIDVTMVPDTDFKLITMNFKVTEDGDDRGPLLEFFAELQNTSDGIKCQFIPDVTLDFNEVVTLARGPGYHVKIGTTVFSTIDTCIQPGETAVLYGVARGITEEDLQNATTLYLDPSPSNYSTDEYLPGAEPIVSAEVVKIGDGYAVSGDITYLEDIYNQAVYVYPRDARGVLVAELMAFPGDLGDHLSGSQATFETDTTTCAFVDFEVYQSWIVRD